MAKKLFIETLGCQMNSRDSEHIIAELRAHHGFETTEDSREADLIIINTCSVRERPVAKLFSEIGQYNVDKKEGAKIGVCGCTASHLGKQIIKKAPYVDFVLGARNISKISQVIDKKGSVEVDIDFDESKYDFAEYRSSLYKASINISIGCDKKCTFCIVPNTRGDEISIPSDLIKNEIKKAIEKGAKEIFLLGQNVNNYGKRFSGEAQKTDFTKLLREISQIQGLERIRFTSPHPLHMDDEFIEEFANNPKICKSIHIPLQSGNTKVLREMKRGYTKEWFLNRAAKIKELVPNVRISTDIIVGFPGESNEEFEDTLDVMRKVKFDQVFNFKYSPRPGTEAATFENPIDDETASKRLEEVIALQKTIQVEQTDRFLNSLQMVFFEELKPNGEVSGFTDNYLQVYVKGSEELLGKILPVKITQSSRTLLKGELV